MSFSPNVALCSPLGAPLLVPPHIPQKGEGVDVSVALLTSVGTGFVVVQVKPVAQSAAYTELLTGVPVVTLIIALLESRVKG